MATSGRPARGRIPKKHVALLIESSNAYARGLLRGIRTYLREHPPWSVYVGEHGRSHTDLSWLGDWRGDGIIARIENEAIADYVRRSGVPAVDLSAFRFIPELPCLETDDEAIALLALKHLTEKGYRHLAFCGDSRFVWSRQRKARFLGSAQEAGFACGEYEIDSRRLWEEVCTAMAAWIRSLPKPVGIFVSYDMLGQKVLEACRFADVDVPDEVGIIGVDNDELMCNLSDPPLTSIIPNAAETGYQAAQLLERMMNGERVPAKVRSVPPLDVAVRQSTDAIAVRDPLVAETIRLMRGRVYEDVNVDQLLRGLPFSRRVVESRFRRALGRSPHDVMTEMKLKLIQRFLLETELSLSVISERVGFKHPEYMSVVFKRETGMTPGAYRRARSRNPDAD